MALVAAVAPGIVESRARAPAHLLHRGRYQPAVLAMALLAVSRDVPAAQLDSSAVFREAPLDLWSSGRQVLVPVPVAALGRRARVMVAA